MVDPDVDGSAADTDATIYCFGAARCAWGHLGRAQPVPERVPSQHTCKVTKIYYSTRYRAMGRRLGRLGALCVAALAEASEPYQPEALGFHEVAGGGTARSALPCISKPHTKAALPCVKKPTL